MEWHPLLGRLWSNHFAFVEQQSVRAGAPCFIAVSFLRRKRNDAQRGPSARAGFSPLSSRVPELRTLVIAKSADFPVEFDDGDGLKNRRLRQCKMSISEVLISATLSVCGEVAERLKAAVC